MSRAAIAAPIPRFAPVTRATREGLAGWSLTRERYRPWKSSAMNGDGTPKRLGVFKAVTHLDRDLKMIDVVLADVPTNLGDLKPVNVLVQYPGSTHRVANG